MKCSEIQFELSLDDTLDGDDIKPRRREHLDQCPVCRERLDQFLEIRSGLNRLGRPNLSRSRSRLLRNVVIAEAAGGRQAIFSPKLRRWLEFQAMPYGVGAVASVLIAFGFLTMIFSGALQTDRISAGRPGGPSTIMLAKNFDPNHVNSKDDISASDFARSRMSVAVESPSVNPQGALIALTKSLVRGKMRDEEVVIVADVFGNGLAHISEVVEPANDQRIVEELRKALETDPAYAPFVPSSVESRPESVRVVFMLQSVNVNIHRRAGRARL
ncbi:MAG: hypothetical protein KBD94_06520 [Pyrinomonadaceae bacterium]|nr:hypothetical protein [Pyrinomonadaceae bacterium]